MRGAYLGPEYSQSEIEARLHAAGARFRVLADEDLFEECAATLADGKAIGWVQGRMEFGPRALGNRSILADPRSPMMQRELNLKIKYRESFRPFAPAVLAEDAHQWFELSQSSPYMLFVADVADAHLYPLPTDRTALQGLAKLGVPRSDIPAVTHVDNSARVQTVHRETNPYFHALLSSFKERTGCPVLINTSFNVRGEPIVCTPDDAFRCFMGTEIELLAVGNCVMHKAEQNPSLRRVYRDDLEPD
jgi:carbamoyltransferase